MLQYWEYIKLELFTSMWCIGLFIAARQGNILYRVKVFLTYIAFRIALVFTFKPKINEVNQASIKGSNKEVGEPAGTADEAEEKTQEETPEEARLRIAFSRRDEIMKPIISCPDCMASIHSAIVLVTYKLIHHIPFEWLDILNWLALAVPAVFLNVLLWSVVNYLLEYVKALKREEEN